ncbi:MAG: hypothetical protein NVSMB42_05380 [Herpetosiphon sp.]
MSDTANSNVGSTVAVPREGNSMSDDWVTDPAVRPASDRSGLISESGRVEAFSDGVLAIAITLLALDLKVPESKPGAIGTHLLTQWPSYVAYLASFFYIGVIWVNHHALFSRIRKVNSGLLWRNLALLLPVSILPFPTATIASVMQHGTRGDQQIAIVLYGVFAATMGATWLLIFSYLDQHPELLDRDVPAGFFRKERRRAVPGILSPVVAMAIGVALPSAALVVFLLLPIFYAATTEGWSSRR